GHGSHRAVGVNSTDGLVARVGHKNSAKVVNRDPARIIESRGGPGPVDETGRAVAGDRRHIAAGVNFPNAMVAGVGDVNVARAITRDALRIVELREGSLVVKETRNPVTRDGRHRATGVYTADTVIARVGDVNDIIGGSGQTGEAAEPGRGT